MEEAYHQHLEQCLEHLKSFNKKNVSISLLVRNKYQPRKKFDEASLEELTNSIRERGIIQPIIVRPSSDEDDKLEIIAGERRWQAAQYAGLFRINNKLQL